MSYAIYVGKNLTSDGIAYLAGVLSRSIETRTGANYGISEDSEHRSADQIW